MRRAKDLKNEYIKENKLDDIGIVAIKSNGAWWHVHNDEELPEGEVSIALRPRESILEEVENSEEPRDAEKELSEEEVNYLLGLISDVVKEKWISKNNKYTIYRIYRSMANFRSRDKSQKAILGQLCEHRKDKASHSETVAVSNKILDELRK